MQYNPCYYPDGLAAYRWPDDEASLSQTCLLPSAATDSGIFATIHVREHLGGIWVVTVRYLCIIFVYYDKTEHRSLC